jgi:hypothetical protein
MVQKRWKTDANAYTNNKTKSITSHHHIISMENGLAELGYEEAKTYQGMDT